MIGEGLITVGTAGGGFASGASKTANIVRLPQASGMSVRQALKAYDIGSQALNKADFLALGGRSTNALEKAAMIQAGYKITTTPLQRLGKSLMLAPTGLTPAGDFFMGSLSGYSQLGRAGSTRLK